MSIARFLAVRKREAMRRLGDMTDAAELAESGGYFSISVRT